MQAGAFGQSWLKPTALFGLELSISSVTVYSGLWGLILLFYIGISLLHKADLHDRLQAVAFLR